MTARSNWRAGPDRRREPAGHLRTGRPLVGHVATLGLAASNVAMGGGGGGILRGECTQLCQDSWNAASAKFISEMDRITAVERHYNFVRQNEADYTDTPTCFDNDLHDSPSEGV